MMFLIGDKPRPPLLSTGNSLVFGVALLAPVLWRLIGDRDGNPGLVPDVVG